MKLRNKKTGEIIDVYKGQVLLHYNNGRKTIHFKSLEELEDWEDYEEPKEYWCISENGTVRKQPYPISIECIDLENEKKEQEIGNYFETEEEAEKAVEKLKAWKRLKDIGCRFILDDNFAVKFVGPEVTKIVSAEEGRMLCDDYRLLFGGEE